MRQRTLFAILVILILLAVGWLFFRGINVGESQTGDNDGFRTWFWQQRGLDLVVQVVLVFAGALGIAAILPIEDEDGQP